MQLQLIQTESRKSVAKKKPSRVGSFKRVCVQSTLWNYLDIKSKKKKLAQSRRVKEYEKMVLSFVNDMMAKKRIHDISIDREDLIQVGMMYVWEAINQYDPSRGAKESTFVYLKLLTKFINLTKKSSNKNRITKNFSEFSNMGSICDSSEYEGDLFSGRISKDFIQSLEVDMFEHIDLSLFMEKMGGPERYVLQKRLEGCNLFKEIKNDDISSVKSLSVSMKKIREGYGRFTEGHRERPERCRNKGH